MASFCGVWRIRLSSAQNASEASLVHLGSRPTWSNGLHRNGGENDGSAGPASGKQQRGAHTKLTRSRRRRCLAPSELWPPWAAPAWARRPVR